ncbi:hypothetical protein [Bacillus cereus]|uniref:hypothetical protein n=1 Tax=Bacillus cereus TaxID=1396 RepID=UPI002AC0F9D8|nr:hypothetical protein [Bacillus cereus]MDZ4519067.1 hypothetical protein [Bacillus cereus]
MDFKVNVHLQGGLKFTGVMEAKNKEHLAEIIANKKVIVFSNSLVKTDSIQLVEYEEEK